MDKTKACRVHFKKRFKERFGIDINHRDLVDLTTDIQNWDNVLGEQKLTNRVTAFDMNFKGNRCIVIFDTIRKVPVTVLTTLMELQEDGAFTW